MNDLLSQLRTHSLVVADTGDFESIRKYQPRDATTNPSLLLKAAQMSEYKAIVDRVLESATKDGNSAEERVKNAMDALAVAFGIEILKIVSHRVSTEVDARLSFDTEATMAKAHSLIQRYEKEGISRDRILIKIASTWEGIRAAEQLEKEGIHCNLTLLFSMAQAVECAHAGVTLISPFVGRILDWHVQNSGRDGFPAHEDPGVQSVTAIYHYFKHHGHKTEVMGASFRNVGEILELAGCDLLTISPTLLEELQKTSGSVERKLSPDTIPDPAPEKIEYDEIGFRWSLNEDAMATEKLADGIRRFAADTVKLEEFLLPRLG